jgi:hypothetical protein
MPHCSLLKSIRPEQPTEISVQNLPYVLVVPLFCSSSWNRAGFNYNCDTLYLLDVCSRLDFMELSTIFLELSSQKVIRIVVFSALVVCGNEVVPLQELNAAGGLSLEFNKRQEPV